MRSNRTPKEEPKDYKTQKSTNGSEYDHLEKKKENKTKSQSHQENQMEYILKPKDTI